MRLILTTIILTMLAQPAWADAIAERHQKFCDLLADDVGQAETGFIFLDDIFYKRLGEEYFVETPTMSEEEYDEFKKNWDTAYKKQIKELIELSTIFKNLCKE